MQVAPTTPTLTPLVHDFSSALAALGPFEPSPHVAVAVSGGSDSMSLALLADTYARARGGHITAITVDHRLRPESEAEAAHVAKWLRARTINHITLTPPHTTAGNNLMSAARQWRYDALAEWCRAHDVLHCLIGHHAGDQRETVALHVARGDTEDGPSGMRRVRNYRGVRFLRPLLGFEKSNLQDYLRHEGMPWVEDPTNRNERFARTRVRSHPPTATLDKTRAAREQAVAAAAVECVVMEPQGAATLALDVWKALPTSIATQLLADLVRTVGQDTYRPRKYKTLALAEALRDKATVKRTLAGCAIRSAHGRAIVEQESPSITGVFTPAKPLAGSAFW